MLLKDLIQKLSTHYPKTLETLTLGHLTTFASLSADVLNRTHNGCGYEVCAAEGPTEFIGQCLGVSVPQTTWGRLWILTYDDLPSCFYDPSLIKKHGIPSRALLTTVKHPNNAIVFPEHSFKPQHTHCLTCKTKKRQQSVKLTIRAPVQGYIMVLGDIETMQYFTGYCRSCKESYTPCYTHHNDLREYYTLKEGQPIRHFQVSQCYFMTHRLANHFNHLQMYGIVSIYNLVASYNQVHSRKDESPPNDFQNPRYTRTLSTNVASLALNIHRLLKRTNECNVRLKSNASGTDERRFHYAMK